MNDLDAMTPADVREFHQKWYVPGNAAVVIAGGYHRDNSGGGEALDDPIKKSQ